MHGNQLPEVTISPVAIEIGTKAWQALLEEVYTTPKPGLVDTWSCGAHTDMDVHTFERSAEALRPYFIRMAEQGYTLQCSPKELFAEIRKTGILAEQAMYRATNGVNTHKGLIFTLGIFCAAAGRCAAAGGDATAHGNTFTITALFYMEQQMTAEILTEELRNINSTTAVSNGEKNLLQYGTFGIRGEALRGYPAVRNLALPTLMEGIRAKKDWNLIKLQTLMVLMSQVEDSNILSRHDQKTLRIVQSEADKFLKKGGAYVLDASYELCQMDASYITRNISAGGCADLLATGIFLVLLTGKFV